jgi:hypothetical protein
VTISSAGVVGYAAGAAAVPLVVGELHRPIDLKELALGFLPENLEGGIPLLYALVGAQPGGLFVGGLSYHVPAREIMEVTLAELHASPSSSSSGCS